jgi:hypothetical protein
MQVVANATYQGKLFLGMIDQVPLSSTITAPGHQTVNSFAIPFKFNLDPTVIIELLEDQAAANHVDLGPLPDLFQIVLTDPTASTTITATKSTVNTGCSR